MVFRSLLLTALICVASLAQAESPKKADLKTALLIIDVQEFYFPGGFMALDGSEEASVNCKRLLDGFRKENGMVVHVGHNVKNEGEFHPNVKPVDGEKVFTKDEVSAFNGTGLLQYLQENKVEKLVICGMMTHMCVEGAVRAAYDLGFKCVLVGDACATRDLKYGDKVIAAKDVHFGTLSTLDRGYATVVDTDAFSSAE